MVEQLDERQWAAETLCPGWNPHDVLAHLVWHTELTVPSLLMAMVRSRLDFDEAAERAASELVKRPRDRLLTEPRSRADRRSSIPGAPESGSVTDTSIHTQDVRRALGLGGELRPELVETSLDFLTTHKNAKYLMDPRSIDGLRLVATDTGWSSGSGPSVEGPGESLIMSLTGRPVLGELAGDGLEILTTRLAG
jgi:uncharacterized protein (TIGR03083 family)